MSNFIILPNQLFDKKYLNNKYKYTLWEHPQYFTKYKFNKKKIILHRASMRSYYDYLTKNKFKVDYLEYSEKFSKLDIKDYIIFNPIDKLKLPGNYTILDTPNLLLTEELCKNTEQKLINFYLIIFICGQRKN